MSKRELLAVYREHKTGDWVATIKQGCLIDRIVVVKFTTALDENDPQIEADARERAAQLV